MDCFDKFMLLICLLPVGIFLTFLFDLLFIDEKGNFNSFAYFVLSVIIVYFVKDLK